MPLLQTRRLVLSLALALLWPATAFAQTPDAPAGSPPPQVQVKTTPVAGYRWHTLVLQHAVPSDILALMHWNLPASSPLPAQAQALPVGVLRIYALQSNNSLLLEATQKGLTQVQQVVKILDVPAFEMIPNVTFAAIPAQNAGLTWAEGTTGRIEIQTGTAVMQAFSRWLAAGHPAAAVTMATDSESTGPQTWTLPGYRLTRPRLGSDDSLTLWIEPRRGAFPARETPPLRHGEVLAVKETTSPEVTFIKVDY